MSSEERFATHLYDLAADERGEVRKDAARARAALAALRRGRGKEPGMAPEMYAHVIPWLPESARGERAGWTETRFFLVASLFAGHRWSREHAYDRGRMDLGGSFREFERTAEREGRTVSESTEKRFAALLECDRVTLPDHLRYAVNLLNDTPIDWATLLDDLQWWGNGTRVQMRWAKTYWYRQPSLPKTDDPATETDNEQDDDLTKV